MFKNFGKTQDLTKCNKFNAKGNKPLNYFFPMRNDTPGFEEVICLMNNGETVKGHEETPFRKDANVKRTYLKNARVVALSYPALSAVEKKYRN